MRITIVYDNEVLRRELTAGWGFSCLIDDEILFDTGGDGVALLHNMKELGIDPSSIKAVALSHGHGDHTGGLLDLFEKNQNLSVYVLPQTYATLKNQAPAKTKLIEVHGSMQIQASLFTTGGLGAHIQEQSLIYLDERGVFVITGCSHPGVKNIMNAAARFGKIYGVIGGLHGFSDFSILGGVKLISPCHCTS
ncbi:MAG: MBL fold metallo-hydrolase [Candidatus Hadarchaeaceae archaeon]